MSGHSKWSTIKHKKAAADAKRGQLFTRLGREIVIAARQGGGNPESNFSLRLAIDKAKAANMPKENIERAIKKATGGNAEQYEETRYEGYGPGGVAIIVEVLTDNRNRTAGEVRATFTKSGGNLAEPGAVSFMFDRVGLIEYPPDVATSDQMLDAAIEAGADDVVSSPAGHEIYAAQNSFHEVQKALEARFGEIGRAHV